MRRIGTLAVLSGLVALGGACREAPPPAPELEVRDAWVRPAMVADAADAPPVNSAAYLVIENRGGAADRLVDVRFAGAARVELHQSFVDGEGIARMRSVEAVEVPAGGEARLAPGGLHVMLMGLREGLSEGDSVDLVLRFEEAGERAVRASVRPM